MKLCGTLFFPTTASSCFALFLYYLGSAGQITKTLQTSHAGLSFRFANLSVMEATLLLFLEFETLHYVRQE